MNPCPDETRNADPSSLRSLGMTTKKKSPILRRCSGHCGEESTHRGYQTCPLAHARGSVERRKGFDDTGGFERDVNHLAHQPHDVLRVIGAVRVGDDAGAFVLGVLILVNHPFERAAVAQAILERLGGNAGEHQRGLILQEAQLAL